ncbi:MAG: short-chain dehydrogenase [Brevundimonas sp.]|uniref:SDR family oxidoreductase n=1 Tax=Brevundimonas albigilva TaxID=1312364 RepID=A0ABY4SKZ0_9CAUL|nr:MULTISPECIES: SDR family oxidoreductase [Brevundimonas]PZU62079.1 MAG: short-chain dehydrogenase [Brevundimonas sp.]URI14715.1 SDR family oxidoreductase [Brevundimonas albigilva]
MARLEGKVAAVSGAASGIGLATAQVFAREGATVILIDRDETRLAAARNNLDGSGHQQVLMDVTREEAWIALAEEVERDHKRLDVLVNNAGFGAFKSIADTSFETWRSILSVNLDSVFLATKYLLPALAASGRGSIVNVSSIRGIMAAPNTGSYCASKGGVRLFTKATAMECAELGNGVRANSIHPGHVETPLTAGAYADPAIAARLKADIPMKRQGQADEIADAILFLASEDSRYMTGAELVVDGGSTAT